MDGNPAQVLARQIARTIPVAYGGGDLGEAAAYRFKCQVNENAKAPAFSAGVPEMCHNEICGWGQHGDITRQITSVVRFRHDFEPPQGSEEHTSALQSLMRISYAVFCMKHKIAHKLTRK